MKQEYKQKLLAVYNIICDCVEDMMNDESIDFGMMR